MSRLGAWPCSWDKYVFATCRCGMCTAFDARIFDRFPQAEARPTTALEGETIHA